MVDMRVKIGSLTLENPIMPASGAFSTALLPSVSSTETTSPAAPNRSSAITNSALRALRIAVTPTSRSAASCDKGASVANPTPRPNTTIFFQSGAK